jgi:hypothetical protein
MKMILIQNYLLIIFLFIISGKTVSQSKKIGQADLRNVENGNNSTEKDQYSVTAHFIDKGFKAQRSVTINAGSLDVIKEQLNEMRNGLDIIIAKVMVGKRNRKEELMKNIPPQFMRETDSLLAKRWAEQYHKK